MPNAMTAEVTLFREVGKLKFTAPFDFSKTLDFVENFRPNDGEQYIHEQSLTKALQIGGHTLVFRVAQVGEQLTYELFSEQPLPPAVKSAAVDQIRFYLSLDDDLTAFYAIGQADPYFAPIIDRLYGMHHSKFLTLCEIACWSILTQHIMIPVARKMKNAIVEAYGSSLTLDGQTYWAFPELSRLVGVTQERFTELIGNSQRAKYLVALIDALSGVDENWLRTAPYAEAEAWLRRIPGIGPWSAGFILLRGLGRMEHMLLDLKPFLAIVPKVYGPDVSMAQLAEQYGDWFGYWGVYMRTRH